MPSPRLFALRNTHTNRLVPDEFFGAKPAAKARRNELNGNTQQFVVTYGPDHWKKDEGERNGQAHA